MSTEENMAVAPQGLASSASTKPILVVGETTSHGRTDASVNATPEITTSRISQTMMTIATVWFAVTAALGFSGFFSRYSRFVGLFTVTPMIIFSVAFAVSSRIRAWAFAFDTRTLVFVQAFRVAGIAFLAVNAVGKLNGMFALWAGLLDGAVGFSAPFAAHYLTPTRTAKQRGLLIAWMVPGILDFLVAIPLARKARVADPASMVALAKPPLSMITTYFVPLALIDYFILSAHLWRQRKDD